MVSVDVMVGGKGGTHPYVVPHLHMLLSSPRLSPLGLVKKKH